MWFTTAIVLPAVTTCALCGFVKLLVTLCYAMRAPKASGFDFLHKKTCRSMTAWCWCFKAGSTMVRKRFIAWPCWVAVQGALTA